ncbi:hypothetical protein H4R33_007119 [Dimargaris cristalligena]|nr:hypothetical protein H4R33_007119 [Dimargaris cristalligena]
METVTLKSGDEKLFQVPRNVASKSALISSMLETAPNETEPIPVKNVQSPVLEKIIEYCTKHANDDPEDDEDSDDEMDGPLRSTDIDPWDLKFIDVGMEMLYEIIMAANYLDIKPLLNLGCKTVANMIKGKTPDEIRSRFNIPNDFTPEEEEQIKKENEWAEDR